VASLRLPWRVVRWRLRVTRSSGSDQKKTRSGGASGGSGAVVAVVIVVGQGGLWWFGIWLGLAGAGVCGEQRGAGQGGLNGKGIPAAHTLVHQRSRRASAVQRGCALDRKSTVLADLVE
jgi:hypothetical protein